MASRTKAQFLKHFKRNMPSWMTADAEYTEDVLSGMAKIWEAVEAQVNDLMDTTYLDDATGEILERHGLERGLRKFTNEIDDVYRERVRLNKFLGNPVDLVQMVNNILIQGECTLIEHETDSPFLGRDFFLSREAVTCNGKHNHFSVLIPKQNHAPYSFFGRENFASRQDFVGTHGSLGIIFELVMETLREIYAAGIPFRVIELE